MEENIYTARQMGYVILAICGIIENDLDAGEFAEHFRRIGIADREIELAVKTINNL